MINCCWSSKMDYITTYNSDSSLLTKLYCSSRVSFFLFSNMSGDYEGLILIFLFEGILMFVKLGWDSLLINEFLLMSTFWGMRVALWKKVLFLLLGVRLPGESTLVKEFTFLSSSTRKFKCSSFFSSMRCAKDFNLSNGCWGDSDN